MMVRCYPADMVTVYLMITKYTTPQIMVGCFPADNVTVFLMMLATDALPHDDGQVFPC